MTEAQDAEFQDLALILEVCARLREMSFDAESDASFVEQGGELIYAIDTSVLVAYLSPIESLYDVGLFELHRHHVEKTKEFFGADYERSALALATVTLGALFGPRSSASLPVKVLLLPPYEEELKSALIFFRRTIYGAESQPPATTRPFTTELRDTLGELNKIVIQHREKEIDTITAYVRIGEKLPPILAYAVSHKDTPLARCRELIEKGLTTANREYLDIVSENDWRDSKIWNDVYEVIYRAKSVTQSKHALNDQLRTSVARDSDAISLLHAINSTLIRKGAKSRVRLVTIDPTILRLFSDKLTQQRIFGSPLEGNFIRTAFQIPELLRTPWSAAHNVLERVAYFDRFLRHRTDDATSYRSKLHEVRFGQASPLKTFNVRAASFLIRQIAFSVKAELREVLRSFETIVLADFIVQAAELFNSVEAKYASSDEVLQIIDEGWERADALSDTISQVLGMSASFIAPEKNKQLLHWILNAIVVDESGRVDARLVSNSPVERFPCFLNFTERQRRYFRALLSPEAKEGGLKQFLETTSRAPTGRLEIGVANAFLSGVAGDWRKAEQLCSHALRTIQKQGDDVDREQAVDECIYFRAIAVRHSVAPDISKWIEAAKDLQALALAKEPDLRFVVEYAALGLSVPYHVYYYEEPRYATVPHPAPGETLSFLRRSSQKFENLAGSPRGELWARLGVQLYTNLCLTYVFEHMIPPRLAFGTRREWPLSFATGRLQYVLGFSDAWHKPSHFVAFIRSISFLELAEMPGWRKLEEFETIAGEIERNHRFASYDRRKLTDLRAYFEELARVSPS